MPAFFRRLAEKVPELPREIREPGSSEKRQEMDEKLRFQHLPECFLQLGLSFSSRCFVVSLRGWLACSGSSVRIALPSGPAFAPTGQFGLFVGARGWWLCLAGSVLVAVSKARPQVCLFRLGSACSFRFALCRLRFWWGLDSWWDLCRPSLVALANSFFLDLIHMLVDCVFLQLC